MPLNESSVTQTIAAAVQHHQTGRMQAAEQLYQQVLQVEPDNAYALHFMGVLAHQTGRSALAISLIGRAIALEPNYADAYGNLGNVHLDQGSLDEAGGCYRKLIELKPDNAEARYNFGSVLKRQGCVEASIEQYRAALAINPKMAKAHNNLGVALKDLGRVEAAVGCYQAAIALQPRLAEAYNNLGIAFSEQGRLMEADASYRQALELQPGFAAAWNNMGNLLKTQGQLNEARQCYEQALAHDPQNAAAHNNLGAIYQEQNLWDEAIVCYTRALGLAPEYVDALVNLGLAYQGQGKINEARASYRHALEIEPRAGVSVRLATMLPVIMGSDEEIAHARASFERNLAELYAKNIRLIDPVQEVATTNFLLAYHGKNDRDLQMKVAQFYEHACPSLGYSAAHCRSPKPPNGRIKVGFISRYMYGHSIGKTTRGVLANLNRERFEVWALFAPPFCDDDISRFIRANAHGHVILPLSLDAARQRIEALELDILFYQDIGMDPFTYFLAFSRLAPVQCTSFGHPVTSGIRNLDYYISTEFWEPGGRTRTTASASRGCEMSARLPTTTARCCPRS